MVGCKAKRIEVLDVGVLVRSTLGTFYLIMFKVIFGSREHFTFKILHTKNSSVEEIGMKSAM